MKIAPSIMSIDLLKLKEGIEFFDRKADMLHVDIMDGHFVKNITMSPLVIRQIRSLTKLPIEAHLMMTDPEILLESCAEAGADYITIHVEATTGSTVRILDKIRDKYGMKAGISVNPETPFCGIDMLLEYVDIINFMAIDPGFPGTRFIPAVLDKIAAVVEARGKRNLDFLTQIDGSVGPVNYRIIEESGVDIIIGGEPTLYNLDEDLPTAWDKMMEYVNS